MTEDVSAGRLSLEAYVDTTGVTRGLQARLNQQTEAIRARIRAEIDTRTVAASAKKAATEASREKVTLQAEVDTRGLAEKVRRAAVEASRTAKVRVQVEVDQRSAAGVNRSVERMRRVNNLSLNVDADTTAAETQIDAERKSQEKRPINIPVRADTKGLSSAGTALMQFSKIPAIVGGVYTLGAAVVQLAGGLFSMASAGSQAVGVLAAIPSLATMAAQGIGAVLIGFSGIGDALSAVSKAEGTAAADAKTSADAQVAAARRVQDARYALRQSIHQQADDEKAAARTIAAARDSVRQAIEAQKQGAQDSARAIRDAQRGVADALQRQADDARTAAQTIANAELALADAHRTVRDAQEGLTDARRQAREEIRRLNEELRLSAGDEASALAAVQKAREDLQDVTWDRASSEQEQRAARVALMEAENNLDRVKSRRRDLAREAGQANQRGVEGSDVVQGAKDTLSGALQSQRQAQIALTNARRDAAAQEAANARAVIDARQAVSDAQHAADDREQADAQAVKDARAALAQTRHDLDDQARSDAHNVAMAQRELADAQKAAAESAIEVSAAQTAAATAMDKLSPAGQRFVRFLLSLKPRWDEVRNSVQSALLPPIQQGITAALPLLDTLEVGLVDTATRIGRFVKNLGTDLGRADTNMDVANIMASNNRALGNFLPAARDLFAILKDIAVVAGPTLVEPFAKWVRQLTAGWRESVHTARETGTLRDFMVRARDTAANLGDIIWNLVDALHGVGRAATPTGNSLLGTFEDTTKRWADWANSDIGQQKMTDFFEAVEPVTDEFGRLVANFGEFLAKAGGSDASPVLAFFKTLNFLLNGINALMDLGGGTGGTVIGALMALAGVGGALGFVSGIVLKMAGNLGKLGKLGGLTKLITGIGRSKKAIDDEVGSDKKKSAALGDMDKKSDSLAKRLGTKLVNAARATGRAIGSAAAATGRAARAAALYVIEGAKVVGNLVRQGALWAVQRARIIAVRVAQLAVAAASRAWAAAQWLLNVALNANPIGLIIGLLIAFGLAVVLLYKKNAAFRRIVQAVWRAVREGVKVAWERFIKPAFRAFVAGLQTLGRWAKWLWNNAVKPAWTAIRVALQTVWRFYYRPILRLLWGALKTLGGWFKWLYEKAVRPAWNNVRDVLRNVWRNSISKIFGAVKTGITQVKDAFDTARKGIATAWGKIRDAVKTPIRAVLKLINTWVIDKFNALSGKVGGPKLGRIDVTRLSEGGTVRGHSPHSRADNIPAWLTAGEKVTRQWASRQMDKHFPGFMEYINRHGRPPQGHAKGGTITNPSGRMTMDGKAVSRIAAAQLALAEKIANVNFRVMQGGFGGGNVAASGTSHNYPGVVDVGPATIGLEKLLRRVGFAAWARNIRGRSSVGSGAHIHAVSLLDPGDRRAPQVYGSWANHGNGLAGANNDPAPHYAWIPNLLQQLGAVNLSSIAKGGGGIGSWLDTIGGKMKGWLSKPLDYLKGVITKPVQALRDRFKGNAMAGMLARIPGKLVEAAGDKIKELVGIKEKNYESNFGGALGGAMGGIAAAIGKGAGIIRYRPTVKQALALLGQPERYVRNVMVRMVRESGGNPRAVNRWDSNAMRGYPSTGLMQVIRGTFQTYAGRFRNTGPFLNGVSINPLANIYAGLNYAIHRYGKSWPSVMLRSGGYDRGGPLYPGSTLTVNNTGKTETVFTNENMVDLAGHLATAAAALQSLIVPAGGAGAGLPPLVGELTLQAREDQMPALLQDVEHELRVIRMGGVHVRRTP